MTLRQIWTVVGFGLVVAATTAACDSENKCDDGAGCQTETDGTTTSADLNGLESPDLGSTLDTNGTTMDTSGTAEQDTSQTTEDTTAPVTDTAVIDDTAVSLDDVATPDNDTTVIVPDTVDAGSEDITATPEDISPLPEEDTPNSIPDNQNPLGVSVKLNIEPFEVKPGTERQVCKHINLPSDVEVDVVRIHSSMAGTSHHFNLYKVIDGTAFDVVTGKQATVHDCSPASEQLSGDAAYIFGAATPERIFDTPKGVAFHLFPGQKLILEQHVINYTAKTVEGGVDLELFFAAPEATIEHHADILWLANWGFFLPPFSEISDTALCKMPYDVEIIGVMSHFHELGTQFVVEAWTPKGTTQIYEDDDWAHPKFEQYSPPVSLNKGDGIQWTCTWNNTKSKLVMPGKNSTDEMCITFALGYPKNTLSDKPIQCNITN